MSFHGRAECIACAGDCELMLTGESTVQHMTRIKREIRGHYAYARRALGFARTYLEEAMSFDDARLRGCLDLVRELRVAIADARVELRRRPASFEAYAICIACKGTGLAELTCEGCGDAVNMTTADFDALDAADVLVHKGCDTGDRYFDRERPSASGFDGDFRGGVYMPELGLSEAGGW